MRLIRKGKGRLKDPKTGNEWQVDYELEVTTGPAPPSYPPESFSIFAKGKIIAEERRPLPEGIAELHTETGYSYCKVSPDINEPWKAEVIRVPAPPIKECD